MTEREEDEQRPSDERGADGAPERSGPDRDLRSVFGVEASERSTVERRTAAPSPPAPTPGQAAEPPVAEPEEEIAPPYVPPIRDDETGRPIAQQPERPVAAPQDEVAPPYVPPVREGDPEPRPERRPEPMAPERPHQPGPESQQGDLQQKLPPVWPGDENQPWFRKERGLPPLPESGGGFEDSKVDPEDLPTPLAEIPARGRAFGISVLLPWAIGQLFAPIGGIIALFVLIPNLFLFSRGQDVGAVLFGLRVLRENGDVAGFYHMFVRNTASAISFLALGFGFWAAFSDPERRTWHDRWLKTYVVKDGPEYRTRKRSSSATASNWFWIIILLMIAVTVLFALSGTVPTETMPPEGGGDATGANGPTA